MIFGLSNAEGAGLISGLTGILGAGISGHEQRKTAREYNKGQMELAKYQADRNVEFWNMQNAYNTPSAQMQRFKDAGLNPNLIYSQGSAGNASGMPEFNMPNQMPVKGSSEGIASSIQSALSNYLSLKQSEKQNELLAEQIKSQKLANEQKGIENLYLPSYLNDRNASMQWNNSMAELNYGFQSSINPYRALNIQDSYRYNNWYHQFLQGELPKESGRKDEMLGIDKDKWDFQKNTQWPMQSAMMRAQMASIYFNNWMRSQMLPYQLDSLIYDSKMKKQSYEMQDILNDWTIDEHFNPYSNFTFNGFGFHIPVGKMLSTSWRNIINPVLGFMDWYRRNKR